MPPQTPRTPLSIHKRSRWTPLGNGRLAGLAVDDDVIALTIQSDEGRRSMLLEPPDSRWGGSVVGRYLRTWHETGASVDVAVGRHRRVRFTSGESTIYFDALAIV